MKRIPKKRYRVSILNSQVHEFEWKNPKNYSKYCIADDSQNLNRTEQCSKKTEHFNNQLLNVEL